MYVADSFLGIYVPQSDALFLTFVSIHILAGLGAVLLGAFAALSKKEAGRHPRGGTAYYWALCIVFLSAIMLVVIRWPHANILALFGIAAFVLATVGRQARRHQWRNWVNIHGPAMGMSYILMLTAFYIDNGPHLPIWKDLHPIVYWLLPGLIGIPLIWSAVRRFKRGHPTQVP